MAHALPTDEIAPNPWPAILSSLRIARGWNRDRMATTLCVSISTIHAWEDGKWKPVVPAQERILALLSEPGIAVVPAIRVSVRRPDRSLSLVTLWEPTGTGRRHRCTAEGMVFPDGVLVIRYGEDFGDHVAVFPNQEALRVRHPDGDVRERIL